MLFSTFSPAIPKFSVFFVAGQAACSGFIIFCLLRTTVWNCTIYGNSPIYITHQSNHRKYDKVSCWSVKGCFPTLSPTNLPIFIIKNDSRLSWSGWLACCRTLLWFRAILVWTVVWTTVIHRCRDSQLRWTKSCQVKRYNQIIATLRSLQVDMQRA